MVDRPTRLRVTAQCKKCPWKVKTDPNLIPEGYSCDRHSNLKGTIAEPGALIFPETFRVMSCHEYPSSQKIYCIGWLANQLGIGNNIALRYHMMNCTNLNKIQTFGEQHQSFEQTLPNYRHEKEVSN